MTNPSPASVPRPGEPRQDTLQIDRNDPVLIAEAFMVHCYSHAATPILRRYRGEWFLWTGTHYRVLEADALRKAVLEFLDDVQVPDRNGNWTRAKRNLRAVSDILDAMLAVPGVLLPDDIEQPTWLDGVEPATDARMLPCKNGLLDLDTRRMFHHSASYFTPYALPFDYDSKATAPTWLGFLDDLWASSPECIDLAAEWFGYCLSGDTSHQKMMLLIGPKRSGKGTIARVLRALMGERNVASPTLGGLAQQFGAASLIGKPLGIVADARLSGRTDQAVVVERLLSISGEDAQSIPRKFKTDWHGPLPTRFIVISNELPRLKDTSGALASRFLVLPTERSFYGREDRGLFSRLQAELPGILNWALDGLRRLEENGKFTPNPDGENLAEMLGDIGSPVAAFVADRCEIAPDRSIECGTLFKLWQAWCEENGAYVGTASTFSVNLKAAHGGIRRTQPRTPDGARVRCYTGIGLK